MCENVLMRSLPEFNRSGPLASCFNLNLWRYHLANSKGNLATARHPGTDSQH
jgi:hypothetical protein